jgi:hypothetical protein
MQRLSTLQINLNAFRLGHGFSISRPDAHLFANGLLYLQPIDKQSVSFGSINQSKIPEFNVERKVESLVQRCTELYLVLTLGSE